MQKNVNEDLPVEAGYAFDMEDDKSISSPEQNLEVDIDPKERPPRRGHVIEGIISGAEAVSEKFSKIAKTPLITASPFPPSQQVPSARPTNEEFLKRQAERNYAEALQQAGRAGTIPTEEERRNAALEQALQEDHGFHARLIADDPTGVVDDLNIPIEGITSKPADSMEDLFDKADSLRNTQERQEFSDIAFGYTLGPVVGFLGGIAEPQEKKKDYIKKTYHHGGLAGSLIGLFELASIAKDELVRSGLGVTATLGDITMSPSGLPGFSLKSEALKGDIRNLFHTDEQAASEYPESSFTKLLFLSGRGTGQEFLDNTHNFLKDQVKSVIGLDDEAKFETWWKKSRGIIELDHDDSNIFSQTSSVAGLFAPFGGIGTGKMTLQQALKNYRRSKVMGFYAQKVGKSKIWENLHKSQVYNFDEAQAALPDVIYRAFKDDDRLEFMVDMYQKGKNLSRQEAVKKAANRRRDIVSAFVGSAFYQLADSVFEDETFSTILSISGALMADSLTKFTKRRAAAGLLWTTSKLVQINPNNIKQALEAFKNSDSKSMNSYRNTFIAALGINTAQRKQAFKESFHRGEEELKKIRDLEEKGDSVNAIKMREKAIKNGLLDEKGRAHGFYIINGMLDKGFAAETYDFGAKFDQLVLQGPQAQQYRDKLAEFSALTDELTAISEDYPLLMENLSGFNGLQAMRNSLSGSVEYSNYKGQIIKEKLISEAEEFQKHLDAQTKILKSIILRMRKDPAVQESDVLNMVLDDISDQIVNKDRLYNARRISALRAVASSRPNISKMRVKEILEDISDDVGLNRDRTKDIPIHGETQLRLIREGFKKQQDVATADFVEIEKKYRNVDVDLSDFFENLPESLVGTSEVLRDRLFKDFAKLDISTTARLKGEIAAEYFLKQMNKESIKTFEDFQEFRENLRQFIERNHKGTPEEALEEFNKIIKNVDTVLQNKFDEAVNTARAAGDNRPDDQIIQPLLQQLENNNNFTQSAADAAQAVSAKYPIPASLDVKTVMRLRSEMSKQRRQAFDVADWQTYHDLSDRINVFDDAIAETEGFGGQFIKEWSLARDKYRDEFSMYLDPDGPFTSFKNAGSLDQRQIVSPHALFGLFIGKNLPSAADKKANALQFRKVFSDPETGEINSEAVAELLYSIVGDFMDSTGKADFKNLVSFLDDDLSYFKDIITVAKKADGTSRGDFIEMLEHLRDLKHIDTEALEDAHKVARQAVDDIIKETSTAQKKAFSITALGKFTGTRLDELNEIVEGALGDLPRIRESLFHRLTTDSRIGYNTQDSILTTVKNSPTYKNADDITKQAIDDIINSAEFRANLDDVVDASETGIRGKTVVEGIMYDANLRRKLPKNDPRHLKQKDFERIRDSLAYLVEEDFMTNAFPLTTRAADRRTPRDQTREAVKRIAAEYNKSEDTIRGYIRDRVPAVLNKLREQGVVDVDLGRGFGNKMNLENEYDVITAEIWWNNNKEAFKAVHSEEHTKHMDILMQLGLMSRSTMKELTARNTPREYTSAQFLGRAYNTFAKRMVSPAYMVLEKTYVDHRVLQANIIKQLLNDPNAAKTIKDIYVTGIFKPKEARDYARNLLIYMGQFGYKLNSQASIDKIVNDLENDARQTTFLRDTYKKQLGDVGG